MLLFFTPLHALACAPPTFCELFCSFIPPYLSHMMTPVLQLTLPTSLTLDFPPATFEEQPFPQTDATPPSCQARVSCHGVTPLVSKLENSRALTQLPPATRWWRHAADVLACCSC